MPKCRPESKWVSYHYQLLSLGCPEPVIDHVQSLQTWATKMFVEDYIDLVFGDTKFDKNVLAKYSNDAVLHAALIHLICRLKLPGERQQMIASYTEETRA